MDENEKKWLKAKDENKWLLPSPAPLFYRLPIIRRIRGAWLAYQVERHNRLWRSMGFFPMGYDEWVVYAVHRGWC